MKPGDKMPPWKGNAGQRVMEARMLLSVHGFLSDAETRKANARIERWARRHGFEIKRAPEPLEDACDVCGAAADILFPAGERFCRDHAPPPSAPPGKREPGEKP